MDGRIGLEERAHSSSADGCEFNKRTSEVTMGYSNPTKQLEYNRKRNARLAANFAKQGREPLKMVRLHKQRKKK